MQERQPHLPLCIIQVFKPVVNGLEQDYFPTDPRAGFQDYLTPDGEIQMEALLDNFQDFIARAGFRILQVPETPQEYVGQHLLFAYLEQFVQIIGGMMYLEGANWAWQNRHPNSPSSKNTLLKLRYGAAICTTRQARRNSQRTLNSKSSKSIGLPSP